MQYFADMIYFTEMAAWNDYDGGDAVEIAPPPPNDDERRRSDSRPFPPPPEAPARPLDLVDDDDVSIIPDLKALTQPQPSRINLPPPRPISTPLGLDVYPTPCGVYEPRIHPFNCTCGCKIEEDNYMLIDSVQKTYMESTTCFYLLAGGTLDYKRLEQRRRQGGYGAYRKKRNPTSQTSVYRRSQKKKAAYKNSKKTKKEGGGKRVYRKKNKGTSQTTEYRRSQKRKVAYNSKKVTKKQ